MAKWRKDYIAWMQKAKANEFDVSARKRRPPTTRDHASNDRLPEDIADDLKTHLALCQELLLTVEREGQALRRAGQSLPLRVLSAKKKLASPPQSVARYPAKAPRKMAKIQFGRTRPASRNRHVAAAEPGPDHEDNSSRPRERADVSCVAAWFRPANCPRSTASARISSPNSIAARARREPSQPCRLKKSSFSRTT